VRQGVAEVDQQTITEVLRDMPLKASDHLGASLLIGPHDLAQVFWIKLRGEHGGIHEVTEQDGQLAAFGSVGGCDRWRGRLAERRLRRGRLECLRFGGGWR
jgi:hypothetical protein